MCAETALSLRGRSLAINQDVNRIDTRLCSNNKKLRLQWLVRVYVEFGLSTIIGNSEDLTLQLAIAHKDDSTRHLSYKVRTTVINQGNLSCTHKRIHNKTKLKPNTNHRWTTMPQTLLFKNNLCYLKSRARGCQGVYEESTGMTG